jgi:hypothetical protein
MTGRAPGADGGRTRRASPTRRIGTGPLDGRMFLRMPDGRRVWIRGDGFSLVHGGQGERTLPVVGLYDRLTRTVFVDPRRPPPPQGDALLLSLAYLAWATAAEVRELRHLLTAATGERSSLVAMAPAQFQQWFAGTLAAGAAEADPGPDLAPPGAAGAAARAPQRRRRGTTPSDP